MGEQAKLSSIVKMRVAAKVDPMNLGNFHHSTSVTKGTLASAGDIGLPGALRLISIDSTSLAKEWA